MNCPICQQEVKSLNWNNKNPFYYASGETTKYKIESVKNILHVRGILQKNVKLSICHIVYIKDDGGEWSNGQGYNTIEQAKSYCNRYEFSY